ncbi:biotin--[acetyl-CoA-carboxylase] ligase [Clostridium tarantellae]|uniref:biotin--[acetyl-CoA-carboxylase] ligase n=1 Tax=Clostridium tarantellae TaxID=39493 RepID=UPI00128CE8F0|nr:biotin--[acetyl-CoA-carboxylase] ligase [Clostridium tarantellae]
MISILDLSKLKTKYIGKKYFFYSNISSTNDIAKNSWKTNDTGTIFLAQTQNKGKGKNSKNWFSPKGGLYLSILIKEKKLSLKILQQIPLLTALCVCKTLKEFNVTTYIKWPNDIILNNKKLGGILCESKFKNNCIDYIIVGIGLNINSLNLNNNSLENIFTSLKNEFNIDFQINDILCCFLNNFEELWEQLLKTGFNNEFLDLYKKNSIILNKTVLLLNENKREIVYVLDILNTGKLVCKTSNGLIKHFVSGDVSIRGLNGYI